MDDSNEKFRLNSKVILTEMINDEELLELCLENVSYNDDINDSNPLALKICTCAAVNCFEKDKEFSEDDVQQKISEMIVGYTIRNMVKKGLVDVSIDENGNDYYSITEKGNLERLK